MSNFLPSKSKFGLSVPKTGFLELAVFVKLMRTRFLRPNCKRHVYTEANNYN